MKRTNPTLLLVDDDPNDIVFLKLAFAAAGAEYRIYSVSGGDEAIAYLSGKGKFSDREAYAYPNLVITDLKMPKGDGFSVLEHFKQNPEWAVIPTIVLSGSQDNDDIKKAYLLGASGYHVKPSSPGALRELVAALCHYWSLCELPDTDPSGEQVKTAGMHKIGQRFASEGKM
jgi:CheY-like chemotaxis protein